MGNGDRPVLTRDKPWESGWTVSGASVTHDGTNFRLWYRPWPEGLAYAESVDGLNWVKPSLGLYDLNRYLVDAKTGLMDLAKAQQEGFFSYESSLVDTGITFSLPVPRFEPHEQGTNNNIIASRLFNNHGLGSVTLTLDDHDGTGRSSRYISLFRCSKSQVETCAAISHDGFRFRHINDGKSVTGRAADTYTSIAWDKERQHHLLYTRTDFGTVGGWREIRGTRAMSNKDFLGSPGNWSIESEWYLDVEGKLERDRRQVYSMTSTVYEGIHFGFLGVLNYPRDLREGGVNTTKRHERDTVDAYLVTSRDGARWELGSVYASQPLVRRGADGAWDNDQITAAPSMITWKGKHWIFYLGANERHDVTMPSMRYSVGASFLELDRFAFLRKVSNGTGSEGRWAFITTVAFPVEGHNLLIDADIPEEGRGELCLSILDIEYNELRGFAHVDALPLIGVNGGSLKGRWARRRFSELYGRTVRIRFSLRGSAKLYGFKVAAA